MGKSNEAGARACASFLAPDEAGARWSSGAACVMEAFPDRPGAGAVTVPGGEREAVLLSRRTTRLRSAVICL